MVRTHASIDMAHYQLGIRRRCAIRQYSRVSEFFVPALISQFCKPSWLNSTIFIGAHQVFVLPVF